MSIYKEFIKTGILFRRPFRVLSNAFYMLISGPRAGKPLMLKFESSTICNLRCRMCPLSKGLSRNTGVLNFSNFKKVFDEINPPYVNLTGIGEPLLNPEIFKIINYTRKNGSLVKLDTNGMLLTEENIKKLIDANPNFLSISLDGTRKESYESIRIGAKFSTVIENIRKLVDYRNKQKSNTKIHLFFVLQKNNIMDLAEFIKFGDKLGVDAVNGTIVTELGKNKNLDNLDIKKQDLDKIKEEIRILKRNVKVSLNIEGIENCLDKKSEKPCFWPWYQLAITWDGYVTPCCIFCDNEIVFGNVFNEKVMKVWNNEKARKFRLQLARGREGLCRNCSVDESFIMDKFRLFYKLPIINTYRTRKS